MELQVGGASVFAGTGGQPFDPSLPTTVFVHGASFDRTVWKLQSRYFAWHGGSVLALDLPGHGRSEGPLRTSIPAMADWLIEVMDTADVSEAALVGHSMGALVAMDATARYGDRVRKLALLGAAAAIPVNDVLLNSSAANDHLALELLTAWGYGRRAQYGGHRMPGMWMTGGGLRVLERAGPDVLHTDLVATNDYDGGDAAAAAVECPTLLVIGARDVMTPAKRGLALAERIPNAKTVVIPKVGHIMLDEAPDETLDALKDFLAA
jgi:pimeloyl-ACP methyl ester carboxylesterase